MAALTTDLREKIGSVSALQQDVEFQAHTAALVRESVIDEFNLTDPIPLVVERREVGLGDELRLDKLVPTMRVVSFAPGAEPTSFTPRKAIIPTPTAPFELPIEIDLAKVFSGQMSVEDVVNAGVQAVRRHFFHLVLTPVVTACGTGSEDPWGNPLRIAEGAATVSKESVDAMLARLGPGTTIFGAYQALYPLFGFGATTNEAKEELRKRGVISLYNGANLISAGEDDNPYFRNQVIGGKDWRKFLFFAAPEHGAVLTEKDMSALDYYELHARRAKLVTGIRMDHGVTVYKNYRYGVIELS
jgi:hypothetical protein